MLKKIQAKIILMLFLILSTIIGFNFYIVNNVVKSALTEAITAEAFAEGKGLKIEWEKLSEGGYDYRKIHELIKLMDDAVLENPEMEFILATNVLGDVIACNSESARKTLKDLPTLYGMIGTKHPSMSNYYNNGRNYLGFTLPIENKSGDLIGNLVFSYTMDVVQKPLKELSRFNFTVCIAMFVSSILLITTFLSIWITNPIKKLYNATRQVFYSGPGAMTTVTIESNDELGRLANSFNLMVSRLNETMVSKGYVDNIISSMTESLFVLRTDNTIELVNDAAIQMFRYEQSELIGEKIDKIIPEMSVFTDVFREDLKLIDRHRDWETEGFTKDGQQVSIRMYCSMLKEVDSERTHIVCTIRDVTELKKAAELLFNQANYDMLTNIPNRNYLENYLEELISNKAAMNKNHVYMALDLDKFKIVNDVCGHNAGDQLLRHIAHMMKGAIREQDFIARVGGDEFSIVLPNTTPEDGYQIGERLCKVVKDFNFAWDDKIFKVGVSIGAVEIIPGQTDVQWLFSAADRACYVSKERGGNRVQFYKKDSKEFTEKQEEVHIVPSLTKAIEENRFMLDYQPIVSCCDEDVTWFEVLIRMKDEEGRIVMPGAFLSPAERYHMMPNIDKWVIHHFLSNYETSIRKYFQGENLRFNINLSGASINDETLLDYIKNELEQYKVPPEVVCFEITETCAVSNFVDASNFIKVLKEMGCSFALDDFGSGLSSFTYLKHLPVDYVKIDGTFVRDMATNKIDYAMVSSINEIVHLLGKKTIAEYVENEEINCCLKEIGVDYGQGYWIGKPDIIERYATISKKDK